MANHKGNNFVNILIIISVVIFAVLLIIIVVGEYFNFKTDKSLEHSEFIKITQPSKIPDGKYNGSATINIGSWQGKNFNSTRREGINRFTNGEKYPFELSLSKSLRNKNKEVIKINYNLSANPLWLRLITDEIIQTSPNHYIGAIQVQILPGLPFTVGYFRLSK